MASILRRTASSQRTTQARDYSLDQAERSQHELTTFPSNESKEVLTDKAESEEGKWVSGLPLYTILGAICLVCFLMLLDTSIVVTAIPQITSEFHSLEDIGWYGSAYQLASAAFLPLTGKIYTNFISKWTFLTFFAIFEFGSLLCGVANSSKFLVVGRAVAGLGASGISNGAFTIIAQCVPMTRRPALIGMVMGMSQLGLVVGPLVGGALTEFTTWRWCFYINLPIGVIVAGMLLFVTIPEQTNKGKALVTMKAIHHKLDLIGFAIFAPAAIQLLLALQYGGNQFAWNSSTVIGLFCGAAATAVIWATWNVYKGDDAMFPIPMLRKKIVWSGCLVFGFIMSQLFTSSYYLPIYFQGVKGVSPTLSGVYLLPMIVAQIFFAIGAGRLIQKVGYYLPVTIVGGVFIAIGNGLISTFEPGTSVGKWVGYQILLGAGTGSALQTPMVAVQNTLQPVEIPVAMAMLQFCQTFGGALYLSFSSTIYTNSLRNLLQQYAPDADAKAVINAGASEIPKVVTESQLVGVLMAYAKSVDRVFYLTAGTGVALFAFAWGMGWKDIRVKKEMSKA